VRTWEGWHHHQTLSLLATWFLTQEARRGKNPDTGADGSAGAGHDRRLVESDVALSSAGAYSPQYEAPFATQRRSPLLSLAQTQPLATATV
jgi:hypothetical protein